DLLPPVATAKSIGQPRWTDPSLWALIGIYSFGGSPIAFVLYQSSIYLTEVMHKSQLEIGSVLWIPPLGWELGLYFWGWVSDRFLTVDPSLRALRRHFLMVTVLLLPLAAVPHVESSFLTLALLFLVMFIVSGNTVGGFAYAARVYSPNHTG